MPVDRRPELAFLLAVCLAPGVTPQASAGLDWDLLRRLSARHRIDGLVWQCLTTGVGFAAPPQVLESLKQSCQRQIFTYLSQLAETSRLSGLIEAEGVAAIALKGCALGQELYAPNPQLRQSQDIDLLVPAEDFGTVERLLAAEGYVRRSPDPAMPTSADSMARYLANAFEYVHPDKGLLVELHHRPMKDPQVLGAAFGELAARSRWIEIGSGRVRCLGVDDMLVYLCCHAAGHAFFRLKWLADIARLLERSPELDMASVLAHARRLGGERQVALTFRMLEELTGRRWLAQGATEPARLRQLIAYSLGAMKRPEDEEDFRFSHLPGRMRELGFGMRLAASWRSRQALLLTHLCHPSDLQVVKLGAEWRWLYAVLGRPLAAGRLLQRWAAR